VSVATNAFVNVLLEGNLITEKQLKDAKDKQIGAKKPIQELLVEMDFIKEEDLIKISSKVFDMPVLELRKEEIDSSATKLISYDVAKRYGVFPVRKEKDALLLAMSNPQDIIALDDIRIMTNMKIKPILSTKSDIANFIERYYQLDDTLYDLLKNIVDDTKIELVKEAKAGQEVFEDETLKGNQSPVVRLTNLILGDAVKERSSDIHIEPQENFVEVRYRIDGDLKSIMKIPKDLHARLIACIKILAEMDIAETRKPQDGRARILVGERKVDLRISIIPIFYGEKVVLRILDTKEARIELDKIGFQPGELDVFAEAINRPQGMVLVTGPTGSGKTSTLYAALNFIKSETKNIITIEDPVEYLIDGINQIQINPVKDVTFAKGLKSILRQDPNIILVGEIRDKETAEIAFRASLTGHLVFSTLHTNNSVSTITRLLDIGLEPYLISSSIILIVAQRLVRSICPHCKQEDIPDKKLMDKFGTCIDQLGIRKFYKGKGCERCNFSGFLGRIAIFEILKFDEKIRSLISNRSHEDLIFKEAKKRGFKTLAESGVEKVAKGMTTLEEVAEVAGVIEEANIIERPMEIREKPKILIADDEEDILKVLEKRLSDTGYEVVKAVNGMEAVECAFREKPDLVVMDVMMPEMDGLEATKILRSRLETAVIPILMLTAKKDKESELKGLDVGADDYVTKPFDKDKLLARIKMLLRRRY
jgi:type IV pilus assembly protein PilB